MPPPAGATPKAFLDRTRVRDVAEPMPDYVQSGPVMLRQIEADASLAELVLALATAPMLAVVEQRAVVGVVFPHLLRIVAVSLLVVWPDLAA